MFRYSILFILIGLVSCSSQNKTEIIDENGYKEVFYVDKNQNKQGTWLRYNPDGILVDSCFYKDGKIHGERKILTEKGEPDILETYDNGVLHGPYTTYYATGRIKKTLNYVQNQIEGEVKVFYATGQLKEVVQFKGNMENGPFREYYENGNLSYEGFYKDGDNEQDTLKEYNMDGKLVRKMFCENGICQTVWTPEKGYIERKKLFENGVPGME